MRKQYKSKNASCGLCKPHKKGWQSRWKPSDKQFINQSDKQIKVFEILPKLNPNLWDYQYFKEEFYEDISSNYIL